MISITGPVFGVVVGGSVTSHLGGYKTKKSILTTLAMATLCLLSALPLPFLDNFVVFCFLMWLLLFFGGAILPSMTGIMLSTVSVEQKTTANSIANLSYNIFGFLPAPFVYGAIYDMGSGGNSRLAMGQLMFAPIIPVILLGYTVYRIIKDDTFDFKENEQEKARNDKNLAK